MKRVEVRKITLEEAKEKIGIVRREERESNLKPVPNRDLSQSVVQRNSLIRSISPAARKIRSQLPYPNQPTRKRTLSESDFLSVLTEGIAKLLYGGTITPKKHCRDEHHN